MADPRYLQIFYRGVNLFKTLNNQTSKSLTHIIMTKKSNPIEEKKK